MKLIHTLLGISLIIFSSCDSDKTDEAQTKIDTTKDEVSPSQELSHRWILVKRTDKTGEKVMNFEDKGSIIITYFEDNGYFRVYDSLTNLDEGQNIRKIEQRKSGQWEVDSDELILRYTKSDTIIIEKFDIQKLNEEALELKSENKNQINYYKRKN